MAAGKLPSNHVHDVWGGNGFQTNWDFNTAISSSCNTMGPKKDHSNYWFPALYHHGADGQYTKVKPRMSAYYRFEPEPNGPRTMFPPGFKIVAGNPTLRTDESATNPASRAIQWTCFGPTNNKKVAGFPEGVTECPGVNGFTAEIWLPFCWDGVDAFDPANPGAHVKYGNAQEGGYGGQCPPSHPTPLPQILLEVHYDVSPFANGGGAATNAQNQNQNPQQPNPQQNNNNPQQQQQPPLSPRQANTNANANANADASPWVLSPNDPTGFAFHADFINGWETGNGSLADAIATDQAAAPGQTNCYMPPTGEANDAIRACFEMWDKGTMDGCRVQQARREDVEGPMGALRVGEEGATVGVPRKRMTRRVRRHERHGT